MGYYNEDRVFPRSVTNRESALFLFNNHYCAKWKKEGVSFKQAIKELKDDFKLVDNFITEENVKSHFEYKYIPKKIESHLTNFITHDIKNLLQGKNDYKDGGIFYGLFLAPKIKYCLTINKYGVIDEHKTFKGFSNVSDNLDRKEYFKMADGDNLIAKVPLSWKKSFSQGVVIPQKMRYCTDCKNYSPCDSCDKLVNQKKEFSANLNELKRQPPNEFGHMLPKYKITDTDLLSYKRLSKEKNTSIKQDTSKIMTNLKNRFYADKEIQDIINKKLSKKRKSYNFT